jgi:hypothetical protein
VKLLFGEVFQLSLPFSLLCALLRKVDDWGLVWSWRKVDSN